MASFQRRKGVIPTPLGEVLAGTRQVALKRSRAAVDRDTWRRAVGRRIAERTDVGSLRNGELIVYVASAAWAQELSLLTREISGVLEVSGIRVEKIRFRVRTELARPSEPLPARRQKPRLPLPQELQERLSRVDDAELRDAIAEAAGLALSRLASEQARARVLPAKTQARAQPASAVPRSAPDPLGAAVKTDPKDQTTAASRGARRGTRGGRSG